MTLNLLDLAAAALSAFAIGLSLRPARPRRARHLWGEEIVMAVSQDIQDFCATLETRIKAAEDAAVATALAGAEADKAQAVADAVAQVKQDHADEMAALNAALDTAAPAPVGGNGAASQPG